MKLTQKLSPRSSNYTNHLAKQHAVKDNMKMVEDSLLALARRQLSVKPYITKEVSKINSYIQSVYAAFDSRNPYMDFEMTSVSCNWHAMVKLPSLLEKTKFFLVTLYMLAPSIG